MAILGTLIKKGIKLRESLDQEYSSPFDLQKLELKKLLIKCTSTQIGRHFGFKELLKSFRGDDPADFYQVYKNTVPIYDYNKIYNDWWRRTREGEKDVTWRGRIKYYALSSGTSESSSKYIPVSKRMLKSMQQTGVRQMLTLSAYDLPDELFTTGVLMLGGSTDLNFNGQFFEGDLSGITTSQVPFWFQRYYKPGKKISRTRDWNLKLDEITEKAPDWNIGMVVGVPAWVQMLIEKIIKRYNLKHIHELWPNLTIFLHGGVAFEPYKKGFEKLLGKPLKYIETYLASEGFIAFQAKPDHKSMRMVLNNGIFFEFIPFNDKNFDVNGDLVENPETLMIHQVEENTEYALLLTTCAGAWRYLIGDVIKFTSKSESEIIISGRTKHYLSLCGEHLSVDNMNRAIENVSNQLNIEIKEFTVAGIPFETLFAHHWYIGTDQNVDPAELKVLLDEQLKELNDDYRVERSAALKEIYVDVLPSDYFYRWMEKNGKIGAQIKFPRVLKKAQLEDWRAFIKE